VDGYAYITTNAGDSTKMDIMISVSGILGADSDHGVHIHQYGDISDDTGTALGSHFNPLSSNHGCPGSDSRHLGDTGNWTVDETGTITQTKTLDLVTLSGVNSMIGRGLVIHSNTDNCVNTTSSGSRLAACVIGIRNHTGNTAVNSNGAITNAVCVLEGTSNGPEVSGVITFSQSTPTSPTIVSAQIDGLDTDSLHGFHIHEWGDISSDIGENAGFHYNPTSQNHGIPNSLPRHIGDMGNIFYYNGGYAWYTFSHDKISLNGDNNVIGRAVILHEVKDNCSQPVGASGSRIAQCVIGIANPTTTISLPEGVPSTQDDSDCPVAPTPNAAISSFYVEFVILFFALIFLIQL